MDTFSNHSTHSLSFIECEVASNKVVSTRKAHVEIPKVEMFGMREGRKGERLEARRTFCLLAPRSIVPKLFPF